MKAELVPAKGRIATRPLRLEDGQRVTIGRGEDCEIQILDSGLSRHHSQIEMAGGQFLLRDLNSRNGTFVNGVRVRETILKDGNHVRLGGLEFIFRTLEERRRQQANLVAAVPEDSGVEYRERLDPDQTSLMHLPDGSQNLENFRRVQRDLSTVYRVGNLINSEPEPQRIYECVVDAIRNVIAADRCYLLLNRAEGPEAAKKPRLEPVASRARRDAQAGASFSSTVAEEAFKAGMCILRSDVGEDARFAAAESIIREGIRSVMCVPVESPDGILGVLYVDTVGRSQGFRKHDLELLAAVGRQAGIAIRRMQLIEELRESFFGTVAALVATIEAKDEYTKGHSQRVTSYATQIGQHLKLPQRDRQTLELASLLHDVGKIGVMESLLLKPGPLNPDERGIIRQHPDIGANIIMKIPNGKPISVVVRHHHERWDGGGYPLGLRGEAIPLLSRVLAVADTIDAMTSQRPYRETPGAAAVCHTLETEQGKQFDPEIAGLTLRLLDSGELALENT